MMRPEPEIWDKVYSEKAVTKSNFSSVRNLSLYRLANSGNEGTLCERSLKDSLSLAVNFSQANTSKHS